MKLIKIDELRNNGTNLYSLVDSSIARESFEDYYRAMQNGFTAIETMYKIHRVIKRSSNESYKSIERTVQLLHGYSKELVGDYSKDLMVGTEGFSSSKRREVALEGIGDWLSKIWNAIKEFFKKIYDFLTGRNVETKTAEKIKAAFNDKSSKLAKSLMGDFLMEGDSPNDYQRRFLQMQSVLYKILDHMDYSLSRCEIYEKFLAGQIKLKNLIDELKRRETNHVGSSGFTIDAASKNEYTINVISPAIYTDVVVHLEIPYFRNLTEHNFKDILKYYGKNNKSENLPGPEKQKIKTFRENLTFDVDASKLNSFIDEVNKEIGKISKTYLDIKGEGTKFTKKISVIDLDDLIKNKDPKEILKELNTPDEQDEVEKLPGLLGVAGKGFMSEIKFYMQLEGIIVWILDMINRKIIQFSSQVAVANMVPVIV